MCSQTSREPFSVHRARRNNTRAREPMSLDPGSRAPPGVHGWLDLCEQKSLHRACLACFLHQNVRWAAAWVTFVSALLDP